jgi:Fe-S cluster assembly protein SufD
MCMLAGRRPGLLGRVRAAAPAEAPAKAQDAFIAQSLSTAPSPSPSDALAQRQMPTTRTESYRFTDLSGLLSQQLQRPPAADVAATAAAAERCTISAAEGARVVVVDGIFQPEASSLSALPQGVYVGPANDAPEDVSTGPGSQALERGGVFAELNAATASGRVLVHVAAGVACDMPLHILYASSSAQVAGTVVASSPQVQVIAGAGARLEIVEEFIGLHEGSGRYYVNTVLEAELAEKAEMCHRVVQTEEDGAFHIMGTYVRQAAGSKYALVEACLGGALSRCDTDAAPCNPQLACVNLSEARARALTAHARPHAWAWALQRGCTQQGSGACLIVRCACAGTTSASGREAPARQRR